MNKKTLPEIVREAWVPIAAPPEEDMESMEWSSGKASARAFIGIPPVDVDILSPGFVVATPLLDLPPRSAAAYLGPFLLSLLDGLELQEKVGFSDDLITRAHTLTCLTGLEFWKGVIRECLPLECQEAVVQVAHFLVSKRVDLALNQKDVGILLEMAKKE